MRSGTDDAKRHEAIKARMTNWIIQLIEAYAAAIDSDVVINQKRDFLDIKIIELINARGGLDEQLGIILSSFEVGDVDPSEAASKAQEASEAVDIVLATTKKLMDAGTGIPETEAWDRACVVHGYTDLIGIHNRGQGRNAVGVIIPPPQPGTPP